MSTVLPPTACSLDRAADALRAGELVGLPTETVYGLAGLGLDPAAISRIYAAKSRPRFNPLILHVPALGLTELVHLGLVDETRLSTAARTTTERLLTAWPSPLTLVLPRGAAVPDLTAAGLDTVALRAPDHPVAQALLTRVGPLAAPSANRSGQVSPTTAQAVLDELGDAVSCVLDGGPCRVGVESTVVRILPDGRVAILRPGWWDAPTLGSRFEVQVVRAEDDPQAPRSPGTTLRHYAPRTPFFALPDRATQLPLGDWLGGRRATLLSWTAADAAAARAAHPSLWTHVIDPDGDPVRTAQGLYATLRTLDALGMEVLLTEPFPPIELGDEGLLHALRDRMSRATEPWTP